MGLLSSAKPSPTKEDRPPDGSDPNDTEVLDEEPRNMLLALISQLRMGMDLQRVTLPTFVLEPRSMLERITDFLSHPDLIFGASQNEDPNERFIQVLRYYLAGWHIKPKGVKKPYNPILGEIFRCHYDYPDGTTGFYIAEQVSHHPPISAFYYSSPDNKIEIWGDLRPKSKFLGNSAATMMEGTSKLSFTDREEDGVYRITMPNMYARGILFGKMVLELGDESKVSNEANGLSCDIEFKTKGFVFGEYNSISGKVRSKKTSIGEVSGKWSDVMELKRGKGKSEVLFDASKAKVTQKTVVPESEQEWNESRRLWSKVTAAIKKKDLDAATEAKSEIEDAQREAVKGREAKQEEWAPVYFELKEDEWRPKLSKLSKSDAKEAKLAVEQFIFGSAQVSSSIKSPQVGATTNVTEGTSMTTSVESPTTLPIETPMTTSVESPNPLPIGTTMTTSVESPNTLPIETLDSLSLKSPESTA